ncbi:hypothetical protein [Burkholderia gladioli]|uniref:hypothetical protein n=1 Tax=Burkholderia gladioli TaxID=28095 RepID=UPI001640D34D|nr:hypothetical protein [Burkholderia gladioli]
MSRKQLPDSSPLLASELRAIWLSRSSDPEVKSLLLEIARMRRKMGEIEHYRKIIQAEWNEVTSGVHYVALYQFRLLMQRELEFINR